MTQHFMSNSIDSTASLGRELTAAVRRWRMYRHLMAEFRRMDDERLRAYGISRREIQVTAYAMAERAANARPAAHPIFTKSHSVGA